ncbi:endonuclease III [Desulfolutivibrio sulfoxidireducens]|uniref:endonuclease III n=1 Tax=Desulfolutivibrio sulfoxidireducens TaxID=2773299 RepID=UPI00159E2354|nr:endonuclease III [Desulfolutivibrio sulfoxidireducens]QLA15875.1 endonuclease III [Desulfolutivibrio sulfoxidireducens]QLA20223.1 endonuclease III [Desulfolutivibrio sulfoxidireducens]
MDRKARAAIILERLRPRYPGAASALTWKTPFELLVATVLAAQCTDARVNLVTPEFFRRWPDPKTLAEADVAEVEDVVHSTGFFRQKAKNLVAAAKLMASRHGGTVPRTLAELTALPGLARKTANIVAGNAYGNHEGIAVDTHVKRLSFRLDLTDSDNPVVIEKDLMPLFPRRAWGEINHLLVLFGRDVCQARKPRCEDCPLADVCPRKGLSVPTP